MSNSKTKFRYKLLAVALSVMMLVAMVPATVFTSALGNTDPAYDYLSAQGFTATYVAEDDSIRVSWTAIDGAVDTLSLAIDGGEAVALDAAAITYTAPAVAYAGKTVAVALTAACDEESRTVEASVSVPATFAYAVSLPPIKMSNNMSLEDILNGLPTEAPIALENDAAGKAPVVWSADGVNYDRTLATEQTLEITGYIALPETVLNRNNADLTTVVKVIVLAAEEVSIKTDLDPNPISKLAGDSLQLSVEGVGTVMGYQWYRDNVAIDGACNPTLNIASLTPADAGNYYCLVSGKDSSVISQVVTVSVAKRDTAVSVTIVPKDGQTRPQGITLHAIGVPSDALGTLTFKAGDTVIGTVDLPATSIDFRATGDADAFNFSVVYSGDDVRYHGSTSDAIAYNFNKGTIHMGSISGLTGVAGQSAQVMRPTTYLDPQPQSPLTITYTYEVDDTDVAEVDANGRLTYKTAGSFNLTITATANDDYNSTSIIIPITVELADNSNLYFLEDAGETAYEAGFSFTIPYINNSKGNGALSVSLEADFAEYLVATLDAEGNKIVITYSDAIDASNPDLPEVLTGAVKVTLTKDSDNVYKSIAATYTLTINKGQQGGFYFAEQSHTVIYDDNSNNVALQKPVDGSVIMSTIVYSTADTKYIQLNGDGTYNAILPGTATITATKPGNSLYADAIATYTVVIKKGEIKGFDFVNSEVHAPYGATISGSDINIAQGGQSDANGDVTYALDIDETDALIRDYIFVDATSGAISFGNSYHKVKDQSTYTAVITATKKGGDLYNDITVSYTLILDRKTVSEKDGEKDYVLDGAELLANGSILSNFGNEDSDKTGITLTPANGYTSIFVNGEWYDSLFLEDTNEYVLTFYLKKANGEVSQSITKSIILDKQGPGATSGNVTITMGSNNFRDDAIDSVWSGFTGALSFDLWKESEKEVVVLAKDDLSPIHEIYYYVQTEGFVSLDKPENEITMEDIKSIVAGFEWVGCDVTKDIQSKKYMSKFTVQLPENTNQKVVVYVKVVDAARNVSYFRSSGVVFDNVAPSCDVDTLPGSIVNITLPEVDGQVGLYNDDVKFDVTIQDKDTNGIASGIQKIQVTVNGIGSNGQMYNKVTTVTVDEAKIKGTGIVVTEFHSKDIGLANFPEYITVDGDFTIPASFDSNHLSILVQVWDFAGNSCSNEYNRTHLAIDSSKPQIEVAYNDYDVIFSNGKYLGNGQSRQATVTITELNFDPAKVDFDRLLLDGKTLGVKPTFTCVAPDYNGDGYIWQTVIDFVEDGDYSFNVSCTDKALNKNSDWTYDESTENPRYWTIDNTKPTIHVMMSNNNVKNGSYFSAMRVATITITERNFSKDYSFNWENLKKDGYAGDAPKAKWIKSDAETYKHEYVITFSEDGDYDFDVMYTDLADNADDGYTCSAVSYQHFTVDTTAPSISIEGVSHQTAYNDVVAPIVTYSDLNLDGSTVSVRLAGVKNGVVQYKRTENSFLNGMGMRYIYDNFTKSSYVDDIYTLSVTLADRAGNMSSRLVSFSVNRFGSTYDLSLLSDILGKYLREEQDIVFTETNVNELDHETLLIKMIKDGTPTALVEGTDYTIEKTGGNGQWSVYKYTIKKDLFVNDGHYNISVYSEDGAGNINESDNEVKKADIAFAIDKTAPVIVPIDLEDDTPYAMDNKTVSVEIKDNLLLDGVKILLNGQEVEYTVDGDNYTFDIGESTNKQDVEIVAVDAAGNTLPIEVKNVLVNANFLVRWFNNTPLFIGSLAGVVLLVLVLTALALFGKKKEKN